MWTIADQLVAINYAQWAEVAVVMLPELWLEALLHPAAVTDVKGLSDSQLGQEQSVRRGGRGGFSNV